MVISLEGPRPSIDPANSCRDRAALVVLGTGIQWAGQTTLAARRSLEAADSVLFAVADPWAAGWLLSVCPQAKSLPYPRNGRPRKLIYAAMVERILSELEAGQRVCAAFYGSPTLLTEPAHQAVAAARAAGFFAQMLPGVSAFDCLCADLNIDGAKGGCQLYEASDLLLRPRKLDPHAHLVLFQVAMIGNRGAFDRNVDRIQKTLMLLTERLLSVYPREHPIVVYEAAAHPLQEPRVETILLRNLPAAEIRELSTLYVPPASAPPVDEHVDRRLAALLKSSNPRRNADILGE